MQSRNLRELVAQSRGDQQRSRSHGFACRERDDKALTALVESLLPGDVRHLALKDVAAIPRYLAAPLQQELPRRGSVTGEEAMHVCRWSITRSTPVNDRYPAQCPCQDQSG